MMMTHNPILDELHATRERLLAESGGTVSGLLDRLRADQATSNRPTYQPSNKNTIPHSGDSEQPEVENQTSPGDR